MANKHHVKSMTYRPISNFRPILHQKVDRSECRKRPYLITLRTYFCKKIFNGQNGQAGGTASLCQILSKSLELRPRYGNFSIFKMAAAAILDFQNLKFLTFGTVKRVELRNHAKFCPNRSNCGRDIVI